MLFVFFWFEYKVAVKIPNVEKATNVPGRSTMIKVFNPSSPNKACMIGIPTNEVFPKPAVKIKQPINFLDQPNTFPNKLNIMNANPKEIQVIETIWMKLCSWKDSFILHGIRNLQQWTEIS